MAKKLYLKCLLVSFIYTILYLLSNYYYQSLDDETLIPYLMTSQGAYRLILSLLITSITFSIIFYIFLSIYFWYSNKYRLSKLRPIMPSLITFLFLLLILIIRYFNFFVKINLLQRILVYTNIESLLTFPIQLILLIPTILFKNSQLILLLSGFLGYIGILFMPAFLAIIIFLIDHYYRKNKVNKK